MKPKLLQNSHTLPHLIPTEDTQQQLSSSATLQIPSHHGPHQVSFSPASKTEIPWNLSALFLKVDTEWHPSLSLHLAWPSQFCHSLKTGRTLPAGQPGSHLAAGCWGCSGYRWPRRCLGFPTRGPASYAVTLAGRCCPVASCGTSFTSAGYQPSPPTLRVVRPQALAIMVGNATEIMINSQGHFQEVLRFKVS